MEIPNVEQLLDYVFTPEDFSDDPSTQEYKKLCRVMNVRESNHLVSFDCLESACSLCELTSAFLLIHMEFLFQ